MTSTSITFKLLSELGLERKREKLFILSVSILEDIASIFLLSFISSLGFVSFVSIETLIFSLVKSLFLILFLILIFSRFLKPIFSLIPQNDENILMLSIFFLSIFLWLSNIIGISPSLGAFLAGSVLSLFLSENAFKIIEKSGLIFISFFFFSFGFYLDWRAIVQNINLLFLLSFIYIFSKAFAIFLGFRIVGFSIKSSVFSSVSMIPLGEMAILLASYGLKLGLISSGIFGIISSLAVISSVISYFLIKNYERISDLIENIRSLSFKIPKISLDFLNYVKEEKIKNFIFSLIFLSLLFYINLPIHQKDLVTLLISLICLVLISFSFFKISSRFISLSLFLMYFEKSRAELKILKEAIMFFILILIIFLYSIFIQEITKVFLLPILIIIILIAIFRNLKIGPMGYYSRH
jgi:Kef-type K+ transport system membrane component KefB